MLTFAHFVAYGGGMKGKSIAITIGLALLVVVGYDYYKAKRA